MLQRPFAVVALCALMASAAHADALLEARLTRIEQTLSSGLLYDTLQRLDRLEQENRMLKGQVEELSFQLQSLSARASSSSEAALPASIESVTDLNSPLVTMDNVGDKPQIAVKPVLPTSETAAAPAASSADEYARYESAFEAMKRGQYNDALKVFESIIQDYPNGDKIVDSLYWQGEAYYLVGEYDRSIESMDALLAHPKGARRAADAMLRKAFSLREKGDDAAFKAAIAEVAAQYPDTAAARQAAEYLN